MSNQVSLFVKCPHCDKSFMDAENLINGEASIRINIVTNTERGVLRLCSLYGCYDHESDVELKDKEIATLYCPHCNKSLMREEKCELCDAPMVGMNIKVGGRVNICSRSGCRNHYVAFNDIAGALNKFYHQYGFSG
jgi:phage FluMu protein Com